MPGSGWSRARRLSDEVGAAVYNRLPSGRMRLARRYLIGGRVQGIGFRFFTQAAAFHEGVYGWVRNVPDGRVEVEAEGEAEALERFEHHIRHGPPGARVERIDVTEADATHRNLGFDIR